MKKTFFYWSPFLTNVGTVKSTINSAISLKKYSDYEPIIINACGEWDEYQNLFDLYKIKVVSLYKFNFQKFLPKFGFLKSRLSYILIFIFCFFPLLYLLKKNKNCFFIAHLITSLPIFIFKNFKINNKLILRISGMPKLNFLRKNFWRINEKKIDIITCPSLELLKKLENVKIFQNEKMFFLPDAIFQIKDFVNQKKNISDLILSKDKKNIIGIGRLTKQKNFEYLINEFKSFSNKNSNFNLYILGDGEEKPKLENLINKKGLNNKVFLLGNIKNVFNYILNADLFVLSSLWEDPGFVLIEAGLGNLFVISSDCPNGPKEILNNGKNGFLFQSNKKGELEKNLYNFLNLSDEKKFEMKKNLKRNISKYSMFKHHLVFKKIFN